ncbi:hypothetical protein [Streptomyces sp. 2231.1]|uniref:hypothetical protein n=1 Tax=Streptomyces sp. 2231.1 TaxID=1855347 RepID=UPI00115FEE53|nr:hypothetical protein [Streptomyces sp. 2231.1]
MAAALIYFWMNLTPSVAASEQAPADFEVKRAKPLVCKVGAYITSLHDLNPSTGSFRADLWVWTLCPPVGGYEALKHIEFPGANSFELHNYWHVVKDGSSWSLVKIAGEFRARWDMRSFPFDRHRLVIALESEEDAFAIRYTLDKSDNLQSLDAIPAGWKIESSKMAVRRIEYQTAFGDPALIEQQSSAYDRVEVIIDVARDEYSSFLKMTGPVYVIATSALMIFIVALESASILLSRLSLLGASLFSDVINMQKGTSELGAQDIFTLNDAIHILGLLLIITLIEITVYTWKVNATRESLPTLTGERRWVFTAVVLYIACNLALLIEAGISG